MSDRPMLFGFALCAAGAVVFSAATVLLLLGVDPALACLLGVVWFGIRLKRGEK